jgi:hypothetical protein
VLAEKVTKRFRVMKYKGDSGIIVQRKTNESHKTLSLGRGVIHGKQVQEPEFEHFYLPFGGKVRSANQWVRLTMLVPWEGIENRHVKSFSD